MAGMYDGGQINLLWGVLAKDPMIKKFGDRTKASFSFPIKKTYTSNGEKKSKTFWVNAEVWGRDAEFVEKNVTKGCTVHVEGEWDQREWTKADQTKDKLLVFNVTKFQVLAYAKPKAPNPDEMPERQPSASRPTSYDEMPPDDF